METDNQTAYSLLLLLLLSHFFLVFYNFLNIYGFYWCVGRGLALRVHFNHVKVGLDSRAAFYTGLGTVDANDCERSCHGVEFRVAGQGCCLGPGEGSWIGGWVKVRGVML